MNRLRRTYRRRRPRKHKRPVRPHGDLWPRCRRRGDGIRGTTRLRRALADATSELMLIQLGWITVADRLNLRGPSGPSVSCSRKIFAEVQVGARTVPRSLKPGRFGYSALSRHFTASLDHQWGSVQRSTAQRRSCRRPAKAEHPARRAHASAVRFGVNSRGSIAAKGPRSALLRRAPNRNGVHSQWWQLARPYRTRPLRVSPKVATCRSVQLDRRNLYRF